ncbi:MAG: GAF domain-containing protein [Phycisphaerae bacterium]|nr:GAF domain-containing protein [Phycisphaerae bacterium]
MALKTPSQLRRGSVTNNRARLGKARTIPLPRDRRCKALQSVGALILTGARGEDVAQQITALVQRICRYRWVGIYKINRHDFVLIASTNGMHPAYPRFPLSQGLSAEAVERRATVVVPDVGKEPKFLPNFWTTKSEIIVPIVDDEHERVLGTIVAESGKLNAFRKADRDFLEGVARIIWRALG